MQVGNWASLLMRAGFVRAAISLGVLAGFARGPTLGRLPDPSLSRSAPCAATARSRTVATYLSGRQRRLMIRSSLQPFGGVWAVEGQGRLLPGSFNSESAATFSSRTSRKDSSTWRSASLRLATLTSALGCFATAEPNRAPGWRDLGDLS